MNPAAAMQLAPLVDADIRRRKYSYSRDQLKRFQAAAGFTGRAVDGIYGGGTAGALQYWLSEAAQASMPVPRPLFKPTTIRPYSPPLQSRPTQPASAPKAAPSSTPKPATRPARAASPRATSQTKTTKKPAKTRIAPRESSKLTPSENSRAEMEAAAAAVDQFTRQAKASEPGKPPTGTVKPASLKPSTRAKLESKSAEAADLGGFMLWPAPVLYSSDKPGWRYTVSEQDVKTLADMLKLEGKPYAGVAQAAVNRFVYLATRGRWKGNLASYLSSYSVPLRKGKKPGRFPAAKRREIARAITRTFRSGPVDIDPSASDWAASYWKGKPFMRPAPFVQLTPRKKGANILYARSDVKPFAPYSVAVDAVTPPPKLAKGPTTDRDQVDAQQGEGGAGWLMALLGVAALLA